MVLICEKKLHVLPQNPIFLDNNRNLAYVPPEFISSTDAQRAPYFLTVAVSNLVSDIQHSDKEQLQDS